MLNSALEPLNCTVFGDLKWVRQYVPDSSTSKLYFLFQEIFQVEMSVVFLVDVHALCSFLTF